MVGLTVRMRNWKEAVVVYFKALYQHSPEWNEKNNKAQSEYPVPWPGLPPGLSGYEAGVLTPRHQRSVRFGC